MTVLCCDGQVAGWLLCARPSCKYLPARVVQASGELRQQLKEMTSAQEEASLGRGQAEQALAQHKAEAAAKVGRGQ